MNAFSSWAAVLAGPSPPTSSHASSTTRSMRGDVAVTLVDRTGRTSISRASCTSRWAANARRISPRRNAGSWTRVDLTIGDASRDRGPPLPWSSTTATRIPYDQLVLATGSRILPEEIDHFVEEAHHFYSAAAALKLRNALDAFKGGRSSSASPACRTSARRRRSRLRSSSSRSCASGASATRPHALLLSDRAGVHHRVRLRHGDADPRGEGYRAAHVLQR